MCSSDNRKDKIRAICCATDNLDFFQEMTFQAHILQRCHLIAVTINSFFSSLFRKVVFDINKVIGLH